MYARFKNINIFNILTTMISNVFVFPFSKRIAISIKSKSNFETFHLSIKKTFLENVPFSMKIDFHRISQFKLRSLNYKKKKKRANKTFFIRIIAKQCNTLKI